MLPRVGHLKEVFHMFAYLKAHHDTEMVFYPTPVEFDQNLFERQDWSFSPYGYKLGNNGDVRPGRCGGPEGHEM